MMILARDVTDPLGKIFLKADSFQTNPDGTTAIKMPNGDFAYQEPSNGSNTYGVFGFSPAPVGAYQECKVQGQLVSFWTRPQDVPYVYTWMTVPTR